MAQRDRVKNFLRRARRARLDSRFRFNDFIGDGDDDDIYKFRFRSRSQLRLNLKRLRDDANVEVYTFDKRKARVLNRIGRTPFSDIPRRRVNRLLDRVARSNNRGRSNERIVTNLDPGLYYVRITPRRANRDSTRYRLVMRGRELPPVVDPGDPTNPGTDPGSGPGTDPGTGPGTDPGTGPGTDPGTNPGADPAPAPDGNDSFLNAQLLPVDFRERTYSNNNLPAGFVEGTFYLGDSDTSDWFKFNLATDSIFNLEMTGLSTNSLDADLDVELRDASGDFLIPSLESLNPGLASESITEAPLEAGTYLIRVNRPLSGESEYALTLSAAFADVDPNDAGDDFDSARVLPLDDTPVYGLGESDFDNLIALPRDFIGASDINDYYKVTLPAGGGFISVLVNANEDTDIDGRPSNVNLQIIPGAAIDNGAIVNPDLITTSSLGVGIAEEVAGSFDEGDYFIRVYPASPDDITFYDISVAAFGTDSIPALTRDINPGILGSMTGSILAGDESGTGTGILYFAANDGTGEALWRSQGTLPTTTKIGAASNIANITNVNGTIYFTSNGNNAGTELWKYDGNAISQVLDIAPGIPSGITDPKFTVIGEKLFFVANNTVNGAELWATDGVNTTLVADIDIGDAGSNSNPSSLTVVGDQLYFTASNNNGDDGLYRLDTSTLNLSTNFDPTTTYQPVTSAELNAEAFPDNLTVANGNLYFSAFDSTDDFSESLWVIDDPTAATATVTKIVDSTAFGLEADGAPEYGEFVEYEDTLFFVARDDARTSGIWKVNAAGNGVEQVVELGGTANLAPEQLTVVGDKLYFVGNTSATGGDRELWIGDGSQQLFLSATPGNYQKTTGLSNLDNLTVVGNVTPNLYFTANDEVNGVELWTSDGDLASTELVSDINTIPVDPANPNITRSSSPENLVVVGNRLFFKANNGQTGDGRGNGQELWVLGVRSE